MARTTSFAALLSLLLFLIVPSVLSTSVSDPLAFSEAVADLALDSVSDHGVNIDLGARAIAASKPPAKPPAVPAKPPTAPAKPPTAPAKPPPVQVTSAAPLKTSTSAAPVKASSSAAAQVSSAPVKASSVAGKVSSAASPTVVSKASTGKQSASATASGSSVSASATASSASASASSTSAPACAIKRAGTAAAGAAADCGTCDPCDDSCDTNVQQLSERKRAVLPDDNKPKIRTLYGNDTSPFLPGEHIRVRIIAKRVNPVLEFDCSATGIPEVCQNMCFGINCRGHPTTLTRNTASKAACKAARSRNSCGVQPANRCSAKVGFAADHSCDEYPFATTLEGQQAGTGGRPTAVTRCVPSAQNKSQGGQISGIYLKANSNLPDKVPDGGQYDIQFDFGNGAAGTGYCAANAATTTCGTLTGSQQIN
ncbi:hypothetical protein DENSPDRAFT_886721 [Dentipellis sp. KUC8613]|nr:hypothetical protein DENSPDRAFT_886721 [Dentipellis sp. KUC8613]